MAAFIPALRGAFLRLSQHARLRRWMETSPVAHRLTSRFIAGLHLDDAIAVSRRLRDGKILATLDYLGENVTTGHEAERARDAYCEALRRIEEERLESTVSVKVTALGLDISEELCRRNVESVVAEAHRTGSRVEFDMESSEYTERTLSIVREMHARYSSVRAVIQAYLYRSEDDVRILNAEGVPVRLCKGAYKEPPEVAWPSKEDVDRNYMRLMVLLLKEGVYPAIATHDSAMIGEALRLGTSGQFEFEMLYGVRRDLQRQVVDQGHRLRLYVPYGTAWYPYFMRRLAERPANVIFLMRSFFRG